MRKVALGLIALGAVVGIGLLLWNRRPISADTAAMAESSNRFGIELYKQIATEPGNHFFSPLGAHAALTMAVTGARNETLEEMQRVLQLPIGGKTDAYSELLDRVNRGRVSGYEIRIVNALFEQTGASWQKDFSRGIKRTFGEALQEVDFQHQADAARRTINAWAEKETDGKIPNLIDPNELSQDCRLILANVVYFKGEWANRFPKNLTSTDAFTLVSGKERKVELMHRWGGFKMNTAFGTEGKSDVYVAEIPYRGDETSLVILLPSRFDTLPELEKKLIPRISDGLSSKSTHE